MGQSKLLHCKCPWQRLPRHVCPVSSLRGFQSGEERTASSRVRRADFLESRYRCRSQAFEGGVGMKPSGACNWFWWRMGSGAYVWAGFLISILSLSWIPDPWQKDTQLKDSSRIDRPRRSKGRCKKFFWTSLDISFGALAYLMLLQTLRRFKTASSLPASPIQGARCWHL